MTRRNPPGRITPQRRDMRIVARGGSPCQRVVGDDGIAQPPPLDRDLLRSMLARMRERRPPGRSSWGENPLHDDDGSGVVDET